MSNNTSLEALKSHLFEALEGVKNLSDPQASECEKMSIEQAKTVVDIADSIIDIYKTQIDAMSIVSKADNYKTVASAAMGMGALPDSKLIQQ